MAIALPIEPLIPELLSTLSRDGAAVVEAAPGAGKTTRIPAALLEAGWGERGEIWVVQPRRLPARLAAARVAAERGERVGETVGYSVRLDEKVGPKTRVRFVTEGVLIRRLLSDPTLQGLSAVLLDEFHERHLAADLALALLARLRAGPRADLGVLVMSATLDGETVRAFLQRTSTGSDRPCSVLRSETRRFEVAVEHLAFPDERPLALQVASVVRRLLGARPDAGDPSRDPRPEAGAAANGDILVFLPGAAEIRRASEELAPLASRGLRIVALHGDLPPEAQARAVAPAPERKVILSTNVAETSVTIEGVSVVIDSGLARIPSFSPWSGLPRLSLAKISQASAVQRTGRAGRTGPGLAIRLYTRHDFDGRRINEAPEIVRLDLAETMLTLAALNVRDEDALWLTPPPAASREAAADLLRRLGAMDSAGAVTERGRRMLRFPVHPRLGRMLVEAEDRGVAEDGAALAALISEKDIRERRHLGRSPSRDHHRASDDGIDVLTLLDWFRQAEAAGFAPHRLRSLGLDVAATTAAASVKRLLAPRSRRGGAPAAAVVPGPAGAVSNAARADAVDRQLARAVLAGFPDRVARRREPTSRTVVLAAGGTAEVSFEPEGDFLVAIDVEESAAKTGRGAGGGRTAVRLGCAISPDWLLDVESGSGAGVVEDERVELDATGERVVRRSRLMYGALVLDETVRPGEPDEAAARLLAGAALARGVRELDPDGALEGLAGRLEVLAALHPDLAVPTLDDAALADTVARACEGLTSLDELRAAGLAGRVEAALEGRVRARLSADTPLHIQLPRGRRVKIHYVAGQPPWIESRLQDFFGLREGPSIGTGRVPLVMHLLAPNGRAVQVTRDLSSFWSQHYPQLRRQLSRRYPRHSWPEDPLA